MTEPSGGSTRPKRPVVVPAVALVAATALGITALMGGLKDAPEKKPQALKVGELLDQGQFDTKVVESKIILERAPNKYAKDKRYLDLVFSVYNKSRSTAHAGQPPADKTNGYGFAGTLRRMTPQVKTRYGPEVFVQGKGKKTSSQLQPGVDSTVIVRFELDLTTPPPEQVSLDFGRLKEEWGPMTEVTNWQPETDEMASPNPLSPEGLKAPMTGPGRPRMLYTPSVVATITLPVKQVTS